MLVLRYKAVWIHPRTVLAISTTSSGEGEDISESGSRSTCLIPQLPSKPRQQVTGDGVHHAAVSASATQLAPIPVGGPEFRYYLTDSPRLYVGGQVYGMYFFGYGNYVSARGILGIAITRHLSAEAGYQLGSRLVVNRDTSTNRPLEVT